MAVIELAAPLAGWALPLSEVPDPVFSAGLAGDGVAIDPVGEALHAPCDGVVALMAGGRHALMVKAAAGDLLLHVGIDTVKLKGEGFRLLVADGASVRAGQPLLEFDLDTVARRAPSAVTPVLLTGPGAGRIVRRQSGARVGVGDFLFAVEVLAATADAVASAHAALVRQFRVPFDHGLHARPAAQVVACLAGLSAHVTLRAMGRSGSARSTVALMSLGVQRGDLVEAAVSGADATAAIAALARLLELIPEATPRTPPPRPATAIAAPPAAATRVPAVIAARGLALGTAARLVATEPVVEGARGDPAAERQRLRTAQQAVVGHLGRLAATADGSRRGLLDAHLALAEDPELLTRAEALLATGRGAGQAWRDTLREAAAALEQLDDPRMRERRADLLDIERQVLRALAGAPLDAALALPAQAIVLTGELLPSQLLALDTARLAGICMAAGGATSHVAILAASLGVPTLVAAGNAVLAIADGTPLVVDAETGCLWVDPPAAERERLATQLRARVAARRTDAATAGLPAVLADGTVIRVDCNLGAAAEAEPAVRAGADGCGLLRTEFLFLDRMHAPDEGEQLAEYQRVATALAGRPLTIRTLDAGGDKPIPFLPMAREENPALGLRGLRTSLWQPGLLETQLRAIVRVDPPGQCRILLPMVTDVADLRAARECLARVARDLGRAAPPLGVMIETPSSALLADQLAAEADFLSIGSNDLSQYTLAIDRLHAILAPRLDGLHPAVLRLIATAAEAGIARGREVCVCGGLASDPDAVPILVGLGVRELSLVPAMIPRIKGLLRTLRLADCTALAAEARGLDSAGGVRAMVRARLGDRVPGQE
jgi:phosphoenolpyruvate-protein phosphotransferase